jgi:hypothetical protein
MLMLGAIALTFGWTSTEAHKPITSPFTFNEDVLPIVRQRCAGCHAPGAVAPMSLLTHADAVPWAESIRAELMAGHMPPWGHVSAPHRFRNVQGLTARELNVLLTWASGGTPEGDPALAPGATGGERSWPLGEPDALLPLGEATVPADVPDHVQEFTITTDAAGARWLRALDLSPGTPAIVRAASVSVKSSAASGTGQPLALWVPGDHPIALDAGTAFRLPPGTELLVRIRYQKTWAYEGRALTDRSAIGLYFSPEPVREVRALDVDPTGTVVAEAARALAVHVDPGPDGGGLRVTARRPDGVSEELLALRMPGGWARRYWFRESVALPKGTRIDVEVDPVDHLLLPPGALPRPQQAPTFRVGLDIVNAD